MNREKEPSRGKRKWGEEQERNGEKLGVEDFMAVFGTRPYKDRFE